MQAQLFRKAVLGCVALGLTWSMLAIIGCGDDDDDEIVRRANLQGAAERPTPVTTNASGSAELTLSEDQRQIRYVLNYTGVTGVTQAHIHVGGPEIAGPIILFLCTNTGGAPAGAPAPACPDGTGTVTGTLTEANLIPRAATATTPAVNTFADAVTQFLNENTYTNVHSTANPGGQIRGQNVR